LGNNHLPSISFAGLKRDLANAEQAAQAETATTAEIQPEDRNGDGRDPIEIVEIVVVNACGKEKLTREGQISKFPAEFITISMGSLDETCASLRAQITATEAQLAGLKRDLAFQTNLGNNHLPSISFIFFLKQRPSSSITIPVLRFGGILEIISLEQWD
jgi:hypothetical protein